jgi:hypothetical protein
MTAIDEHVEVSTRENSRRSFQSAMLHFAQE